MPTTPSDDAIFALLQQSPPVEFIVAAIERAYDKRRRGVIDVVKAADTIHIRIIDPAFERLTYVQREALVKGVLKEQLAAAEVPDFAAIITLHLITPAEPIIAIDDSFDDTDLASIGSLVALGREHYAWRANSFDEMASAAITRFMLVCGNLWLMCRDMCYCAAIIVRKFRP